MGPDKHRRFEVAGHRHLCPAGQYFVVIPGRRFDGTDFGVGEKFSNLLLLGSTQGDRNRNFRLVDVLPVLNLQPGAENPRCKAKIIIPAGFAFRFLLLNINKYIQNCF